MKKSIIIAGFALGAIVFGTSNVHAQKGTNSNSASTTVNLILADVISIDGGVAIGGGVDFNYATAQDYNEAKTVQVENSLVITSSRNFDVKVKADKANFISGSNSIPVDVLQIKAIGEGSMIGGFKEITLSTDDQILVSDATLGAKKSVSIDYSISAEKAQTVLLGKAPGTYTQQVTYTATAL